MGKRIAEARQQSGAEKLKGHDIMALERFDPEVKHMIVFYVLSYDFSVWGKGDKMCLFLMEDGFGQSGTGRSELKNLAKVSGGNLHYDHRDRALQRNNRRKEAVKWLYSM